MTIGNKIRFFRNLRGFTQAELGEKVNLPGDRIRQYENDVRTPKADKLKDIADALDVDVAALSDIDIKSEEDIMQILFELEDKLSIDIEKRDGRTVIVFDSEDSRNSVINTYLNYWYDKKQVFSLDKYSDDKDPRVKEYKSWRGRFKSNETVFEDSIRQNIADTYRGEIAKLSKAKTKPCETISDLVRVICNISPVLLVGTDERLDSLINKNVFYGFVFDAEKLLKMENAESFARFLYEIEVFEKAGCKCYSTIEYTGELLKITYFIGINGFNMVTKMVDEWVNYTRNKVSYSLLAKRDFEKQFESDLKFYNDATIKEVIELYGKSE